MIVEATIIISALFLLAGSIADLRTGEIPEKLSRSYIVAMLFLAIGNSFLRSDPVIIGTAAAVGLAYYAFGYATYYLGQWGGGDVKILAGIGLSLGLLSSSGYTFPMSEEMPYYVGYFLNMGVVMVPYIFLYGMVLGMRNKSVFPEYTKKTREWKFILALALSFMPSAAAVHFGLWSLGMLYLIVPFFLLVSVYMKTLERTALVRVIPVKDLVEGDVPSEEIKLGKRVISPRNINGLEISDVEKIRKLSRAGKFPKKIAIKYGIKSVPILALAFLILVLYGNFFEAMLLIV